jgi:hypothetical protein
MAMRSAAVGTIRRAGAVLAVTAPAGDLRAVAV